ncbi:cysteine hydrolase family protein [Chloroflexota bacterium]
MNPEMAKYIKETMARALTTLKSKVNPSHTALIVVDVQNDFCAEGGMMDREGMDLSMTRAMVPRLVKFIDKARKVGLGAIIYIQNIYNAESNYYLSDVWLEQALRRRRGSYVDYPVCAKNSWNGDFYGGIKPLPNEVIVNKHRFSAFQDTDLDLILRSKGIRTLIMSGIATNVCVETTSRVGFMKDYYIVFLKDCTATYSVEFHNNTLKTIDAFFGQVVDSNEVVQCWKDHLSASK